MNRNEERETQRGRIAGHNRCPEKHQQTIKLVLFLFLCLLASFLLPVRLSLSLYLTIACKRWMRAGRQAGIRSHFFSSYANKERNYDDENLGTSLFFSVSFSFFYSLLLSLHYCQILTRP